MTEIVVVLAALSGGLLFWWSLQRKTDPAYRRKNVLTGTELEFFSRLKHALPECTVCPQVAVSALIEPVGAGIRQQHADGRIQGKRVAYAVFDERMQAVAVIEINHRSSPKRHQRRKDACLASAGIPTIRFPAKQLPSETKIRRAIYARNQSEKGRGHQWVGQPGAPIEFQRLRTTWHNTANLRS